MQTSGWIMHCRAGYEPTLAAEATAAALQHGIQGWCRARPGSGWVVLEAPGGEAGPPPDLVFARAAFQLLAELRDLPTGGRAERIAAALPPELAVRDLSVEHPDSDEGRPMARFCRRFQGPARRALEDAGMLRRTGKDGQRLHLFFPSSDHVLLGIGTGAGWPMGIPRLRMPKHAPSRSVMKLEEAFHLLVPASMAPQPGERAVDLGAAPGGWTWLLLRRGLQVIAVDNGALTQELADDPGVHHLRTDAFKYRPPRPVDWMFCDVVERPGGIAKLVRQWFRHDWCRRSIFNLKLPMKRPLDTVRDALDAMEQTGRIRFKARQLYHDREEITVFATADPRDHFISNG